MCAPPPSSTLFPYTTLFRSNPSQTHPATPWEAEIDRLFNAQMYARTFEERKKLYDRARSEEHTSELQYQIISYAVFCLKKKKTLSNRHGSRAPSFGQPHSNQ